ncbi:hypothetical protein [Actibacterium ureilyticum]|uniref:hypothetical protein n=1 Tax=Actibacterium ureilyticum TaxID=1590614 RepID=UPI000BAAA352|nr:hypothetical protein [Actibacterium ureilyticum]
MSTDDEWAGILWEGEEILWQGQPDGGIYIHPSRWAAFGIGACFSAIGVVLFVIAISGAEPVIFLFAVLWTGISGYLAFSQSYWPAHKRRHTFYTLTNRRAILGIALPRRRRTLKTYEITAESDYDYVPGPLGSIIFDYVDEGVTVNDVPQKFAAGFMRFADADRVWPMIQRLQQDMRDARADDSNGTTNA